MPILNLLTNEHQCAYKTQKSTIDIIFDMGQKFINKVKGKLRLDISKAFDEIQRSQLWWIPYENGIPGNLLKIIIIGHNNTKLCARHTGNIGKLVDNKTRVLQGSPLSAQLLIIYADYDMGAYTTDINNAGVSKISNIIRGSETEHTDGETLYLN